MEYHVGDRVFVKAGHGLGYGISKEDEYGTVCLVRSYGNDVFDIGICFDNNINGHNCGGECEFGHGWFLNNRHVFPAEDGEDLPDADTSDLDSFILSLN